MVETSPPHPSLAEDILRGAKAIGDFIGLDARRTFYGLQNGFIPASKEGATWVSTRSRLESHYRPAPPEPPARPATDAARAQHTSEAAGPGSRGAKPAKEPKGKALRAAGERT